MALNRPRRNRSPHTFSTNRSSTRFSPPFSNATSSLPSSAALHDAVAELLVKHASANWNCIAPCWTRWLVPCLDSAGASGHKRKLTGESLRRECPRIACHCRRPGPLDIIRQFVDEAARDAGLPVGVDPPVRRMAHDCPLPRAGQADICQPSLFLQRLHASFIQRSLIGKQALLPARQEHCVELQSFCPVQCHEADAVALGRFIVLHDQRHVVEKARQCLEVGQRANQLLQVLQPARRLRRLIPLPHVGIAAFIEQRGDCQDMAVLLQPVRASARTPAATRPVAPWSGPSANRSRPTSRRLP